MPSELTIIGFKNNEMIRLPLGSELIILIRLGMMEIKYEQKISLFIND